MRNVKTHRIHNLAFLFLLIAPITVFFYATYIYNPHNAGDIGLYILQLIADTVAIFMVSSLWVTILLDLLQAEHNHREITYDSEWVKHHKITVDVMVPVSSEPIEIIQHTLSSVAAMDYPHTTYVLDDGGSASVKALAKEFGFHYLSRPKEQRHHAKSGNLNFGIKEAKGEFLAVFDADHAPEKNFLTELLPFFAGEKVALVQSPQHFTNTQNFIASGTAQAQEIFYRYVQPAKNNYNAAFCVGTNMVYRRKAIDEIGGIALRDHSEDIWTTILLHEKGYESVYYNKVLANGRAPETIASYFRQQNRWSRGGFTLFFQKNPALIRELTFDQRIQYLISNVHYFSGFAILIYLILPILYLLFSLHPMNVTDVNAWFIHYVPYAITVFLLPLFLLQDIKLSTISTSLASFVPYLQAFLSVVLKNKYKWIATESAASKEKPILFLIWPIVLYIVLAICAVFVGWYNVVDVPSTVLSTIWTLINAFLLLQFIFHDKGVSEL